MTIILPENPEPSFKVHECDTPKSWMDENGKYKSKDRQYEAAGYPKGTLWQCPICKRWQHVVVWWFNDGPYWTWVRVRFWNLILKNRIKNHAR